MVSRLKFKTFKDCVSQSTKFPQLGINCTRLFRDKQKISQSKKNKNKSKNKSKGKNKKSGIKNKKMTKKDLAKRLKQLKERQRNKQKTKNNSKKEIEKNDKKTNNSFDKKNLSDFRFKNSLKNKNKSEKLSTKIKSKTKDKTKKVSNQISNKSNNSISNSKSKLKSKSSKSKDIFNDISKSVFSNIFQDSKKSPSNNPNNSPSETQASNPSQPTTDSSKLAKHQSNLHRYKNKSKLMSEHNSLSHLSKLHSKMHTNLFKKRSSFKYHPSSKHLSKHFSKYSTKMNTHFHSKHSQLSNSKTSVEQAMSKILSHGAEHKMTSDKIKMVSGVNSDNPLNPSPLKDASKSGVSNGAIDDSIDNLIDGVMDNKSKNTSTNTNTSAINDNKTELKSQSINMKSSGSGGSLMQNVVHNSDVSMNVDGHANAISHSVQSESKLTTVNTPKYQSMIDKKESTLTNNELVHNNSNSIVTNQSIVAHNPEPTIKMNSNQPPLTNNIASTSTHKIYKSQSDSIPMSPSFQQPSLNNQQSSNLVNSSMKMTTKIESTERVNHDVHKEKEPDAVDQIVANVLTEQRRKDASKLAQDLSNKKDLNNPSSMQGLSSTSNDLMPSPSNPNPTLNHPSDPNSHSSSLNFDYDHTQTQTHTQTQAYPNPPSPNLDFNTNQSYNHSQSTSNSSLQPQTQTPSNYSWQLKNLSTDQASNLPPTQSPYQYQLPNISLMSNEFNQQLSIEKNMVTDINSNISSAKQNIADLLNQIKDLSRLRNDISAGNHQMSKEQKETKDKMQEVKTSLYELTNQRDVLREEIKKYNDAKNILFGTSKQIQTILDAQTKDSVKQQNQIDGDKKTLMDLKKQIKDWRFNLDQTKNDYNNEQRVKDQLEDQIKSLKAKKQTLIEKNQQLTSHNDLIAANLVKLESKFKSKRSEYNSLKINQNRLETSADQITRSIQEKTKLLNTMDTSTQSYNSLLISERKEMTDLNVRKRQYELEQDLKNNANNEYVKQITSYLLKGEGAAKNIYELINKENKMLTQNYKNQENYGSNDTHSTNHNGYDYNKSYNNEYIKNTNQDNGMKTETQQSNVGLNIDLSHNTVPNTNMLDSQSVATGSDINISNNSNYNYNLNHNTNGYSSITSINNNLNDQQPSTSNDPNQNINNGTMTSNDNSNSIKSDPDDMPMSNLFSMNQ